MENETRTEKLQKKYFKEASNLNVGIDEEKTAFEHYERCVKLEQENEKLTLEYNKVQLTTDAAQEANKLKEKELELKSKELTIRESENLDKLTLEQQRMKTEKKKNIFGLIGNIVAAGGAVAVAVINMIASNNKIKAQQENLDKAINYESTGCWTTSVTKNVANDAEKI